MKKTLSLVLALCLACMLIPAMAEEEVTGTWYLKTMAMGEQVMNVADMGMTGTMIMNEDGTVAIEMYGETTQGTWKNEDGKLVITVDGTDQDVVIEDGILTMKDGTTGVAMTYSKEAAAPAYTPAEPKADAALEDYTGKWGVAYIGMAGMLLDVNSFVNMMATAMGGDSVDVDVTAQMSADIEGTSIIIGRGTDSEQTLEGTFADGKLTVAAPEGTEAAGATLEIVLLEDGVLHMSTTVGEQTQDVYFVKVEAAEEPAA